MSRSEANPKLGWKKLTVIVAAVIAVGFITYQAGFVVGSAMTDTSKSDVGGE
ncbi:hypothetical protein [Erythrobacter sp.]|uniref:hypothetical protein n=1 Tax=Erythrobacter sp. TaxID=1042 RepID=UPI002EB858F7|nr:hypothetical protein [Erythrobacter sp.]